MINIEQKIASMTVKQKLGQMFLVSFVGKNEVPETIKDFNRKGILGGIIYFSGSNVEDIEQLKSLSEKVQGLKSENPLDLPYFITLDQEGGQLTALHRGETVFPGNMALGAADDEDLTRQYAEYVGHQLKYAGISINFAPVLDVSYREKPEIHLVDNRMISDKTDVVSRHGVKLVEGIQNSGIMACGKHFPGQRLTDKDTHHQADIIDFSMELLEEVYFPPFRKAIDAGVTSIMTHHGVYTAFDDKPASLSKPIIDFLRKDMGFDGLVVTDDLIMKAVQNEWPGAVGCELAIKAGVDQIIITGFDESMLDELVESVEAGRIDEAVIDAALRRIFKAKNEYVVKALEETPARPSRDEGDKLALALSNKAVTIEKNDGILPLKMKPEEKLCVDMANPARLVMSDTVNFYDISLKGVIEKKGLHPYVKEAWMPWNPTDEEKLSLFDLGFIADVMIFTTVNAYNFTGQLDILKQIHALRQGGRTTPKIIAVATRSPDDIELLKPYADAVLYTSGLTEHQIEALVNKIYGLDQ